MEIANGRVWWTRSVEGRARIGSTAVPEASHKCLNVGTSPTIPYIRTRWTVASAIARHFGDWQPFWRVSLRQPKANAIFT